MKIQVNFWLLFFEWKEFRLFFFLVFFGIVWKCLSLWRKKLHFQMKGFQRISSNQTETLSPMKTKCIKNTEIVYLASSLDARWKFKVESWKKERKLKKLLYIFCVWTKIENIDNFLIHIYSCKFFCIWNVPLNYLWISAVDYEFKVFYYHKFITQ